MKALAGATQIFDDYRIPRDPPRLLVKPRPAWVDVLRRRTQIDETRLDRILTFLTHSRADIHGGGRLGPAAAHTPFLDLADGRVALVPTLAVWNDGQHALRSVWKTRAPADYNARISALNHRLSEEAAALFASRGWPAVARRNIQGGGDIDAGTGADDFFICGECKVFIDDPIRGADDPDVWRELERNVRRLEDVDVARRTLTHEGLEPRHIVGLVVVPGRGQSPVDFGDQYALTGIEDLRELAGRTATPRELWTAIKENETADAPPVVVVTTTFDGWIIESDGVNRRNLLPSRGPAPDAVADQSQ